MSSLAYYFVQAHIKNSTLHGHMRSFPSPCDYCNVENATMDDSVLLNFAPAQVSTWRNILYFTRPLSPLSALIFSCFLSLFYVIFTRIYKYDFNFNCLPESNFNIGLDFRRFLFHDGHLRGDNITAVLYSRKENPRNIKGTVSRDRF